MDSCVANNNDKYCIITDCEMVKKCNFSKGVQNYSEKIMYLYQLCELDCILLDIRRKVCVLKKYISRQPFLCATDLTRSDP